MEPVPASTPNGQAPLRAAAGVILGAAKSVLAAAPAGDPTTAIHDFRVAMKRWRAWLRLVEPFVGDDARLLRREAALLTRGLGASRDVQAAFDAFGDIVKEAAKEKGKEKSRSEPFGAAARQAIADRLTSLRGVAESSALDEAALAKLSEAVLHAEKQVAAWPLEAIAFADLAAGLARSYRRARRRQPEDWSAAADADLHELRKAVVTLRYQVDIVASLWPRMFRTLTSELQKLRSQLGKANDLAVLGKFARPRHPLSRWRRHVTGRADARRQQHRRRAQRIAGRVFAESPRAFRRKLLALWQAAQRP